MMKRGIVLLALLMLCLLTACGSKNTLKAASLIRDNTGIDPDSFVYLDAGVWPENEYTEELPVPPGTVNTAYIDTTNEFCVVMLNEVSDADFDNYIAELENNKFSQIENVDEEIEGEGYISTGTLYSNGTTSVSMSLADGTLGMYIVIVEEGEE